MSLAEGFTLGREPGNADEFGSRRRQQRDRSHDNIRFFFAIIAIVPLDVKREELAGPDTADRGR